MPKPPLPERIQSLLAKPNPAVVASIRPDGTPHTATTWYEWRDGRVLLNMDSTRRRLAYMRANPAVSVNVIDVDDMYTAVSLSGRIVEFLDDEGFADIDALAQRYLGSPYPDRATPRVSAWLEVDTWFVWEAAKETAGIEQLL